MPKGFKRKKSNSGVGVDFRKVKHKVGKKLPLAKNATDTTIVSRSISLPQQSITVDKTGAVVTHRNLTLKVRLTSLFSLFFLPPFLSSRSFDYYTRTCYHNAVIIAKKSVWMPSRALQSFSDSLQKKLVAMPPPSSPPPEIVQQTRTPPVAQPIAPS